MIRSDHEPVQLGPALASLGTALGVAVLIWLGWGIVRPEEPTLAAQRSVKDVLLTWRCENGHHFKAAGDVKRIPCDQCGALADVTLPFYCPEHGRMLLQVRYGDDKEGGIVITHVRYPEGRWGVTGEYHPCPYCGRIMSSRPPLKPPPPEGV